MNDRPLIDKELLSDASNNIVVDALIEAMKLTPKRSTERSDADGLVEVNATLMVLVQQVCVKTCVFTSMGDKDLALKSADLLHMQIVRSIETMMKGNDDETTNN